MPENDLLSSPYSHLMGDERAARDIRGTGNNLAYFWPAGSRPTGQLPDRCHFGGRPARVLRHSSNTGGLVGLRPCVWSFSRSVTVMRGRSSLTGRDHMLAMWSPARVIIALLTEQVLGAAPLRRGHRAVHVPRNKGAVMK